MAAENGGIGGQLIFFFYININLLTRQTRFCSNIFKSTGEALNLRYTLINENF